MIQCQFSILVTIKLFNFSFENFILHQDNISKVADFLFSHHLLELLGELRFWSLTLVFFTGAPALTSRNFKEADFVKVVEYLDKGVKIALEAQSTTGE